ncbi:MAG: DNA-processing protein DprA [Salibacteraceae bacterium]
MTTDFKYLLALIQCNGIGDTTARKLVIHYGSGKDVFEKLPSEKKSDLPAWPKKVVDSICAGPNWLEVEKELEFMEKADIQGISIFDEEYPRRLKFCNDAPLILFIRGNVNLNHSKVLAVVGTRRATPHGKELTKKIIAELKDQDVLILSGLAFGIDIEAHQAALGNKLTTVAVLAHGLDRIYPAEHRREASEMEKNGAIISEFRSGTKPDRENFPKRNRIVAGMADAVLVIESQRTGGSMITADLGFGYGRDVFAIPGRPGDKQSEGCNFLIRQNKASLVESATDIKYLMNWKDEVKPKEIQKQLFVQLTKEEENLLEILKENGKMPQDELCLSAGMTSSQSSIPLLNLELNGLVRSLPGKVIELV